MDYPRQTNGGGNSPLEVRHEKEALSRTLSCLGLGLLLFLLTARGVSLLVGLLRQRGILQAAAPSTGDAAENRARGQLLYHVGRWIYLTDAWDDLEEDACAGRYNPISARFEGIEEEQARQAMRATLRHSLNLAASAGNLMPLGVYTPVVENILYLGLPMVEELVFTGRWREARKQMKRSIDGRTII